MILSSLVLNLQTFTFVSLGKTYLLWHLYWGANFVTRRFRIPLLNLFFYKALFII